MLGPSRLINKLQPGSVPKVNEPVQNWHKVRGKPQNRPLGRVEGGGPDPKPGSDSLRAQLENIGNFLRAITRYGVKPHDIFEANDLFENTNHTQVQSTLIALASQVTPLGGGMGSRGGPRGGDKVLGGSGGSGRLCRVPVEDTKCGHLARQVTPPGGWDRVLGT